MLATFEKNLVKLIAAYGKSKHPKSVIVPIRSLKLLPRAVRKQGMIASGKKNQKLVWLEIIELKDSSHGL